MNPSRTRGRRWSLRSSTPGHEGNDDVGGVAVEVLAPIVVHRRRPRVGVAGGDLDFSEGNAGVQRTHDEACSEHVRVDSAEPGPLGDRADPAVRRPAVEVLAVTTPQDRARGPIAGGQVDGPGRPRTRGITAGLLPFPRIRSVRWPRSKPRLSMSVAQASLIRRPLSPRSTARAAWAWSKRSAANSSARARSGRVLGRRSGGPSTHALGWVGGDTPHPCGRSGRASSGEARRQCRRPLPGTAAGTARPVPLCARTPGHRAHGSDTPSLHRARSRREALSRWSPAVMGQWLPA